MKVSVLEDFARCSVFYRFRHELGARIPKQAGIIEKWDSAMHQIAAYIFHQTQNGRYPSQYLVKQAWGRIWALGRTKEEILFYVTSWRDEAKKRQRKGLDYALRLQEFYKPNPGRPILVDYKYKVPFGKRELEGTIDLVREVDGVLELVDFRTDDRLITHFIRNDYAITAASWAVRQLLGRVPDRMVLHHLPTSQLIETTRTDEDYKALYRTMQAVERAIEGQLWIPVLNAACVTCPYLGPCERKEWM